MTGEPSKKISKGQLLVASAGFLSLFSLVGIMFYGLPFFYDFWVRDYGWSRATVTSGFTIAKIVVSPLAFVAGWMIDKFGPKRLMISGILMGGIALIGLGHVTMLAPFYIFYLFNAMGYMFGGPLPNQVLISRWFDKSRGKAMGIAYLGIGIGGMLVPQAARWLNSTFGWHYALMILGFLMVLIALPVVLFVKDNPPETTDTAAQQQPKISLKSILKKWPFYLLLIGSTCSIGAVSGTNQNLKLFFSIDLKYTQEMAANAISLVLAFSIVGRLLMGWLADRIPKKYVMILIYALVAGSIPILYFAKTPGFVYLFAIIFGIGMGGDYMIIPLMAAELFGVRVLGRIMGIILTTDGLGEALSPLLVAWLRDRGGSYVHGFTALIFLAAVGLVAIALLPRKKNMA